MAVVSLNGWTHYVIYVNETVVLSCKINTSPAPVIWYLTYFTLVVLFLGCVPFLNRLSQQCTLFYFSFSRCQDQMEKQILTPTIGINGWWCSWPWPLWMISAPHTLPSMRRILTQLSLIHGCPKTLKYYGCRLTWIWSLMSTMRTCLNRSVSCWQLSLTEAR